MPYRLFVPGNYDPKKKYPLLLSLHGAGSRGNDNFKHLRPWVAGWMDEEVQKKYPCIILMVIFGKPGKKEDLRDIALYPNQMVQRKLEAGKWYTRG